MILLKVEYRLTGAALYKWNLMISFLYTARIRDISGFTDRSILCEIQVHDRVSLM